MILGILTSKFLDYGAQETLMKPANFIENIYSEI